MTALRIMLDRSIFLAIRAGIVAVEIQRFGEAAAVDPGQIQYPSQGTIPLRQSDSYRRREGDQPRPSEPNPIFNRRASSFRRSCRRRHRRRLRSRRKMGSGGTALTGSPRSAALARLECISARTTAAAVQGAQELFRAATAHGERGSESSSSRTACRIVRQRVPYTSIQPSWLMVA
jgi:hypothetical protein